MKVLLILSALLLFSGCVDSQELAGPWEMWVIVSSPSTADVWRVLETDTRIVRWAAVPGDSVRCVLVRNSDYVMELFDWRDKSPGESVVDTDLSSAGKGGGFRIVIYDDQGFFGTSEEFTIR